LFQQSGELTSGVGTSLVLKSADLGFLVETSLSGKHILGLGMEGINFAIERFEKFDNTGFLNGQIGLVFGGNMADQEFTTVSQVDGGDGIEKGIHFEGADRVGVTLATGKIGQKETFLGQGQGSDGGHGNGHLGAGEDVGGRTDGQSQGIKCGHGGNASNKGNGELVHLD